MDRDDAEVWARVEGAQGLFLRLDLAKLTCSAPTLPAVPPVLAAWRGVEAEDGGIEGNGSSQAQQELLEKVRGAGAEDLETLVAMGALDTLGARLGKLCCACVAARPRPTPSPATATAREPPAGLAKPPAAVTRLRLQMIEPQAARCPLLRPEARERARMLMALLAAVATGAGHLGGGASAPGHLLRFARALARHHGGWPAELADPDGFGDLDASAKRLLQLVLPPADAAVAVALAEGLGEVLGKGRHGIVRAAGPLLAVKVVALSADGSRELQRVFSEVSALRRLDDGEGAAVRLEAFWHVFPGGQDSEVWLVQERAARSLADWRAAQAQVSAPQCAALVAQVAGALAKAHAKGVVHYDVRCDNVLVFEGQGEGELPRLALGDFGEAHCRARHGADRQASSRGAETVKPPEMLAACDPEQAARRGYDRRKPHLWTTDSAADVWALGCLAFELLSGEPLFEEALTSWPAFFARLSGQVEPLVPPCKAARLRECLGGGGGQDELALERLVLPLLELNPTRRPTAAQAQRLLLLHATLPLARSREHSVNNPVSQELQQ